MNNKQVNTLSSHERKIYDNWMNEYREYCYNFTRTMFSFENWIAHTKSTDNDTHHQAVIEKLNIK